MDTRHHRRPNRRPAWLPPGQLPFTSPFVDVEGDTVPYVHEGSGPALLFVHAGPACSFIFRGPITELRQDFRCVALDFPGSGLSLRARPGERPTMAAASRLLARFIDALDLGRLTLVVHDVGGPVALAVAARHPDRVAAVAVTESFGRPLGAENPRTVSGPRRSPPGDRPADRRRHRRRLPRLGRHRLADEPEPPAGAPGLRRTQSDREGRPGSTCG